MKALAIVFGVVVGLYGCGVVVHQLEKADPLYESKVAEQRHRATQRAEREKATKAWEASREEVRDTAQKAFVLCIAEDLPVEDCSFLREQLEQKGYAGLAQ